MAQLLAAEAIARECVEDALVHPRRHFEPAQDGFLIRLIGDAEAGLQSHVLAELSQKLGAESVDGPALDALHARAELTREALGDFAGRLVREGEDADPLGVDLELVDQESDPLDEAEGLSRARAREHEKRPWCGLNGQALRNGWDARNRNGVGAYRRRFRDGRCVRSRGSVRARGGDRQVSDVL